MNLASLSLNLFSILKIFVTFCLFNFSEPGMITFSERFIFVQENSNLIINVHRINGHDGDVSVRCRSLQQTAESGTDFLGGEQILSFHDQVVSSLIFLYSFSVFMLFYILS